MNKVKILTDSVCDILNYDNGKDGSKIFDFDYLPLYVRFDRELKKDFKEIRPKELYEKVNEKKQLPKTTCPSPDDYYQFFKKYTDQGYDIVFFSIGSELSGGIKSATLGAELIENGKVFIVDSQNISTGQGIQVIKACKYRDEGKSAEEIAKICNENSLKATCKFCTDTMEYLYKGGRCNALTALIGSMLRIKPIIASTNGKLMVHKVALGKKNALLELVKAFEEDFVNNKIDLDNVFITHSETYEEALFLKQKLVDLGVDEKIIHFSEANCTVATHCGPKCIGIIYNLK